MPTKHHEPVLLARDATPGEVLASLVESDSREIRRALASNPNTPMQALFVVGQEFPREFWENPGLALLSLENPKFLEELPAAVVCHIAAATLKKISKRAK